MSEMKFRGGILRDVCQGTSAIDMLGETRHGGGPAIPSLAPDTVARTMVTCTKETPTQPHLNGSTRSCGLGAAVWRRFDGSLKAATGVESAIQDASSTVRFPWLCFREYNNESPDVTAESADPNMSNIARHQRPIRTSDYSTAIRSNERKVV